MAISIAAAVASSMADVITAAVDAGSGAGTLKVYSVSKPATPETGATGTLLATFTLADPAAAAAVSGVATYDFSPAISATVAATGTAGWFRVADSNGTAVFDGTVGTSGQDLNFSSVSWVASGTVTITGGTLTQPTS
jgi:hypothetical protein